MKTEEHSEDLFSLSEAIKCLSLKTFSLMSLWQSQEDESMGTLIGLRASMALISKLR